MKFLVIFPVLMLTSLTQSAPITQADDVLVIDESFFPPNLVVYNAEYDIINLVDNIINVLTPLNAINLVEDDDNANNDNSWIFFTLADIKDGVKDYKGVFLYHNKTVQKVLENGRDTAASNDDSKVVYIGATDGLHIYNGKENKVKKWGSIIDSVINVAKIKGSDELYILTDNYEIYKVTAKGTKKTKMTDVSKAQQMILDNKNVLYYVNSENKLYALSEYGVKQIDGMPQYSSITLLKPPFIMKEGIPVVLDKKIYNVHSNGTADYGKIDLLVKPTGYSAQATLIQYYGYNKKLYQFNMLDILLDSFLEALRDKREKQKSFVECIATRFQNKIRI